MVIFLCFIKSVAVVFQTAFFSRPKALIRHPVGYSNCIRSRTVAECVVYDYIIADQDGERYLSACSRNT